MENIESYYDDIADLSDTTRNAIECLEQAKENIQSALQSVKTSKEFLNNRISPLSTVTLLDVQRNLLFLDLLVNQTFGVINTSIFEELLEITSYSIDEETF